MSDFEVQVPALLALVVWTGLLVGVAVAAVRVAPVAVETRAAAAAAVGVAVALPTLSAFALPVLGRRLSDPVEDDDLQRRVEGIADEVGVGTPAVRVTPVETPQVVALPGTAGPPTLLVSRPVLGMDDQKRRAVLAQAVARLASGVALAAAAGYGVVALVSGLSRGAGRVADVLIGSDRRDPVDDPTTDAGQTAARMHQTDPDGHYHARERSIVRVALVLPAIATIVLVGPIAVVARHVLGAVTRPGHRAADATAATVVGPETLASALESIDTAIQDARDRGVTGSPPMDALSVHPVDDRLSGRGARARATGTTHPPLSDRLNRLERAGVESHRGG